MTSKLLGVSNIAKNATISRNYDEQVFSLNSDFK